MDFETASLDPTVGWSEKRDINDELMTSFEAFKQANDQRLQEIEKRASADVLLEEKVENINLRLTQLSQFMQRPALETSSPSDGDLEMRAAFKDYVCRGETSALEALQVKDFQSGVDDQGGYFLPKVVHQDLQRKLTEASPFRQLARYVELESGAVLANVAPTGNFEPAWAMETSARPTTDTPQFEEIRIELHEVYASPAVTTNFLSDVTIDIEGWLINELAQEVSSAEGDAFINGNGMYQPSGLLRAPTTEIKSEAGESVLINNTGMPAGFSDTAPADVLIETAYGLPAKFRQKAAWLMNASTQAEIRKFKDDNNNYLWSPSFGTENVPTLMGFPLYEDPNMPDAISNETPIAFGDFSQAYTIIGRSRSVFIRDPFSAKPFVLFYSSHRVGGASVNLAAYQLIKIGS